MKVLVVLAASAMTLAGCSDPKAASKDNFQAAINRWIEKTPPCLAVPDGTLNSPGQAYNAMPRYVAAAQAKQPFAEETRQRRLAPLDALVDAGLLKATRTEIEQRSLFGNREGKIEVIAYDFTDKGKAALKEDAGKASISGKRPGFCYGKPQVNEVTQFTQPGDMMGMTLSQVSYSYRLADLPDWAKSPKLKAAFPDLARNTAESIDAKATVVLTNDGWKHEKEI